MFDFFAKIIGYIETLFNLVIGAVTSFLLAIKFLLTGVHSVAFLAGLVPEIIGTSVMIFLAFAVVKFILGR